MVVIIEGVIITENGILRKGAGGMENTKKM
jgi:hypothetical protein